MIAPSLHDGLWVVETGHYQWRWDSKSDVWTLCDGRGRRVARGPLKPSFVLGDGSTDPFLDGAVAQAAAGPGQLTITWSGSQGRVVQTWRFADDHFALGPLEAQSPRSSGWARVEELVGLSSHYALLPGLSMSSLIPPMVDLQSRLQLTTTLGAGAMRGPGLAQQWGQPCHWFALSDTTDRWNAAGARGEDSAAVCIGLSDLPLGDFWVRTQAGAVSLVLNVRSDLWGWFPNGQPVTIGLDLEFFLGDDFEQAPRAWYRHRARHGQAGSAYKAGSKRDVRRWTLFNTWGSQIAERIQPEQLNQQRLDRYFAELEDSGLRVGHFVVDDKWEGSYGVLSHDQERFPQFEAFLDRVRAKGYGVGLWAAFLRCEDPARVGLTEAHLMKGADGQVLWFQHQTARYGIYDVTHPEAAEVLASLATQFMKRYRPDLIKFDFGYELPTLDVSRPFDPRFRGERLLLRGLDVLLGAMKSVNPDLVVMYYGLSPLLAPWYDLHSTDDMVYCPGDYDLEGNRRLTLASFLGEVGMPVSSSTGYDWATGPDLWFDATPLGVPGTLLPFGLDENGRGPEPSDLALFNGLAAVARSSPLYSVEWVGGHSRPGARILQTASWRRREAGNTVLLALREGTSVPEATTQGRLVLASLDDQPLTTTTHWGLVPASAGFIRFSTPRTGRWSVTVHRLRAPAIHRTWEGGAQEFPFERSEAGTPVEWYEFQSTGTAERK